MFEMRKEFSAVVRSGLLDIVHYDNSRECPWHGER